ncbi:MAG TPA: efflux transporter periplasmic adaptor subunit, partial [Massilia sp.]|nr:efflux transporter periplasmic adaptor subunit [Massilia sp.]
MIRDTSLQDALLTPPPAQKAKRRALLVGAAVALAAVAIALLSNWSASERSVSASRLRIA